MNSVNIILIHESKQFYQYFMKWIFGVFHFLLLFAIVSFLDLLENNNVQMSYQICFRPCDFFFGKFRINFHFPFHTPLLWPFLPLAALFSWHSLIFYAATSKKHLYLFRKVTDFSINNGFMCVCVFICRNAGKHCI